MLLRYRSDIRKLRVSDLPRPEFNAPEVYGHKRRRATQPTIPGCGAEGLQTPDGTLDERQVRDRGCERGRLDDRWDKPVAEPYWYAPAVPLWGAALPYVVFPLERGGKVAGLAHGIHWVCPGFPIA